VAAVLALVALAGFGWFASRGPSPALAERAVAAHQALVAVGASAPAPTEAADDITRRAAAAVGQPLDAPDLVGNGYRLLGALREPAVDAHAVALVYSGANGPLTCLIVRGHRALSGPVRAAGGIHLVAVHGVDVASWWEDGTTYLLVGNLSPDMLLAVAQTAAQQ